MDRLVGRRLRQGLVCGGWLLVLACGRTTLKPGDATGGSLGNGAGIGGSGPTGFSGASAGGAGPLGGTFGSGGKTVGTGGASVTGGVGPVAGMPSYGEAGSPDGGEGGAGGASVDDAEVVQLSVGPNHCCAVNDEGRVSCWGLGSYGALGYGSFVSIGDDELPASAGHVGLDGVAQVAVGEQHSCALLTDGAVRCWGGNAHGQLGYGNTRGDLGGIEPAEASANVAVTDQSNVGTIQLAAGAKHTCALLADQSVVCWGSNQYGQLGYGHTDDIGDDELPSSAGKVQLTLAYETGITVVELVAGTNHTCALRSDGSVYCWGDNAHGQLGLAHTDTIGDDEVPTQALPVEVVPASDPVVAGGVTAGEHHTCAVLTNQTVRCWGSGLGLGLGGDTIVGDDEHPWEATPLDVGSSGNVSQVEAGARHTCVLSTAGVTKCWGDNAARQLGYAHGNPVPLPVDTGAVLVTLGEPDVQWLVAGGATTCARLSDGSLKCWGQNDQGQLGQGNTLLLLDGQLPSSLPAIQLAH